MKNLITLLFIILGINIANCQLNNVGIGTTTPDSSAVLDITSIDKGVLLPRMDSTSRKDILNPKDGLILYDSTTYSFWFFRDTIWTEFNWLPNDDLGNHIAGQNLNMSDYAIQNMAAPINANDAATKEYVDSEDSNLQVQISNNQNNINDNETNIVNVITITDNHEVSIANNTTAINNHTTNDTDLSPTNELQTLSISGQDLMLSSGNTVTLPTSAGVFENNGGVIRNTGANTDDFVFGDSQLPAAGVIVDDQLFFFDESKGAFRAGRLNNSNVWGTDKIGSQSIAMGINPEASGLNSTSIGQNTVASGDKSIAIGNSSTATNDNALAMGSFNDATGSSSVALGANSNAVGNNAVAIGLAAGAQGDESLATGNDTEANGLNSTAMGYRSEGNGDYTTAMGWQSKANGDRSTSMGIGTRADAYGSLAFGRYNEGIGSGTTWIETDPILEIGIGPNSLDRQNAMTILKNGTVSFKEYTFPNVDGTTGQILETDGSGNITWTTPSSGADNLGNHTATQDLDLDGQRITNLDDPTLDGDAATKFYVDLHTDADSDAFNEIQVLSVSNDTIFLSDGGFVKLPSTGVFENNSGVVRNTGADTDDFIFGEDALPASSQNNTGKMFFFDEGQAAFRAGQIVNSKNWNPDSLGLASIAMGAATKATGNYAISLGVATKATGNKSFVGGSGSTASGETAVALGESNQANGDRTFVAGSYSHATENNATAVGNFAISNGFAATSIGSNTEASGFYSTAMGRYTKAEANNVFVVGRYNEGGGTAASWIATEPVFEIGIGDPGAVENAMTVRKDGLVSFKEYSFPNVDGTVDQVLATDGNGNISWADDQAIFENNGGTVRNSGADTDDFVFGEDALPASGQNNTGKMFFFDEGQAAFRAGQIVNSKNWNPDSLGLASIAMGAATKATGNYAISLGVATKATGNKSFVGGSGSTASGETAVALGESNQAKGDRTFVAGSYSHATENNATAIGNFAIANGFAATSIGSNTEASGFYSTSMGRYTKAEANNVFVVGRYNEGGGTAASWIATEPVFEIGIGDPGAVENAMTVRKDGLVSFKEYSFPNVDGTLDQVLATDGNGNISWANNQGAFENSAGLVRNSGSDTDDFIFGEDALPINGVIYSGEMFYFDKGTSAFRAGKLSNSTAWSPDSIGIASIAMGKDVKATGDHSIALGELATATGTTSFAVGTFANATATGSVSIGYSNDAIAGNAIAMGRFSEASGLTALALGDHVDATGQSSVAFGFFSEANGDASFSMGDNSDANGQYSTSIGHRLVVQSYNNTALGRYNDDTGDPLNWVDTDPLFQLGNGTSLQNKSNAFTIYKNGVTEITDSLYTDGNIRIGNDAQSKLYIGNVFMQSGSNSALRMDGSIGPYIDDTYNLGSSNFRWNDIWATNGVIQTSDKRLKKDIEKIHYGLDEVLTLNPVSYLWNKESSIDKKHVGLIAQELEKIIPEVVNKEGEYLGVKYAELVPVLIQAIKDQHGIINAKSQQITSLETELNTLSTEVNSIMDRLSKIEIPNKNEFEEE